MKILHIGDYHFKPKGANYEQGLMIEKMLDHLKKGAPIDLLLFSGDLIFSGSNSKNFELAHESLFSKVISELKIPESNIIVCQGNHDIRREDCSTAIINYFDEKVVDNDRLNDEYVKKSNDFCQSLKPSENFYNYVKAHYINEDDERDELFSLHNRIIGGHKVSIVTLNTSWLSCGHRADVNFLMFPTIILKEAINRIKDSDCKIIMLHHPLSYFKEFNSIELEDLIHKEFNLMFSGHIHREQIMTKFAGNNGIYSNTTQATLTFDKDAEIGYSLIEYNIDEGSEIIVNRASYSRKDYCFTEHSPVYVHVPYGEEKAKQNKLRRKITSKFRQELNTANELLLDYDEESNLNFIDFFTPPILSTSTEATSSNTAETHFLSYETFFSEDSNYLIFGKDKCGKTSLLKRIQLHFLKNFSSIGKTPLYLDYKELESKSSGIDIKKIIRLYYDLYTADVDAIIKEGRIVLLIDNFNSSSAVNKVVVDFLEANPKIQFIICSDYLASRVYLEELDHLNYQRVYFKDLGRKEIRLYTEKHETVRKMNKEEVIERITKMCLQLQLPINYWTISLLLLIYKKSNDDYNKNLFGVLDLCVDEILQKKQLILLKNRLSFEQYKEVCSIIAHYLFTKHRENVYSSSYLELIQFVDSLLKNNIRLVGDSKEIFDFLLQCGILKEKDSRYTFRLNGIFEYFLAYYIYQHQDFKDEILEDDGIYLSFKNELEIYSGFNRKDEEFLSKVFMKTKNVFDKIISRYKEYGTLDKALMYKLGEANEVSDFIRDLKLKKALSHEVKDAVLDSYEPLETESDVHLKKFVDSNNINSELLEKYLNILSRIYKNSDNISNSKLICEVFDYLLDAYANFGFFMIEEVANSSRNEKGEYSIDDKPGDIAIGEELLRLVANFIPVVTQVLLYDGLGHRNVVNVVNNHIEKYKGSHKDNQYKLFLLYFLLMDIDIKANKKLVDEVFKYITLSPLKVSTFFKMNFYLAFKAYENSELENYFKNKVQEAQLRIEGRLDKGSFDKFLSKKQKGNIVRKSKNR